MADNKIKVLVVDDSAFMRSMLVRMVEKDPRFVVVGKAENGAQALEMVPQLKPHVVTMDVEMPVMNGIEALQRIMEQCPVPVIMVSSLTEAGARETMQALDIGAVDFIPKALQDKENNIFHVADVLHEKLFAAAQAKVFRRRGTHTHAEVQPVARPSFLVNEKSDKAEVSSKTAAVVATRSSVHKLPMVKVLLIGSSTGGPKALQDIIPHLPAGLRVPVVIAQHMPPNFTKAMAVRLNEQSELTVLEAEDGVALAPAHVYVAPGGKHMRVVKNADKVVLKISDDKGESVYRPSVELLARSVLDVYGAHTLAVMLTGMGNDGSRAFGDLFSKGAHVIAQDASTCVVYGMPKAVVDAGHAHDVLQLETIAPRIRELLG